MMKDKQFQNKFTFLAVFFIIIIISSTFYPSIQNNLNSNDLNFDETNLYDSYNLNSASRYGLVNHYLFKINNNNYNEFDLEINSGSFINIKDYKKNNWKFSKLFKKYHSTKLFNYIEPNGNFISSKNIKNNEINFSVNTLSFHDNNELFVNLNSNTDLINDMKIELYIFNKNNRKYELLNNVTLKKSENSYQFNLNKKNYLNLQYLFFIIFLIFFPFTFIYILLNKFN